MGFLALTLTLSVCVKCATVNTTQADYDKQLFMAEQLGYVLREAEDDDKSGACQPDEEQDGKNVHAEMRDRGHSLYCMGAAALCKHAAGAAPMVNSA